MKPSILQMGTYPEWDQVPLDENYDVQKIFEAEDPSRFLAEIGPKIRAIATRGDLGANAEVINACPKLELISVYGVGYDSVDIELCKSKNVQVTNTPDVLSGDVADLAIAMALDIARGVVGADRWARQGEWKRQGNYPLQNRFWGKKAGILGLGRIGLEIARRLEGFSMDISYHNRRQNPEAKNYRFVSSLNQLAEETDFLFVALSATAESFHIVDENVLNALGAEGYLINISRASNIDEVALLNALENQQIAGAALDVFENEPDLNPRFQKLNNVLLQPHQASATFETRKAMGQLMRDNLDAHFGGRKLLTPVL